MANQVVVIIAVALAALLIFFVFDSMRKRERHERKHKEAEHKQTAAAAAPPPQTRPGVQTGTEANFEQLVSSWPGVTVAFFWAPWCGYCKSAKPKFESTASQVDSRQVQLISVNCDEAKSIGKKYAGSFPTMVKFHGSAQPAGKLVGDRSADEMMAFIQM